MLPLRGLKDPVRTEKQAREDIKEYRRAHGLEPRK